MEPWIVPIKSNMRKIYNKPNILEKMEKNEDIELCSLAHFRGRTFENAIIIVDEFQNLTLNICTGYSFKISYLKECFNKKQNIKLLSNNYKKLFNTKKIKELGLKIPLNFGHYYNKNKSEFYTKNVNT